MQSKRRSFGAASSARRAPFVQPVFDGTPIQQADDSAVQSLSKDLVFSAYGLGDIAATGAPRRTSNCRCSRTRR